MSKQEQISKAQVEVLNRLKAQVSTALAHPSVRTDVDLSGLLIMDQENYLVCGEIIRTHDERLLLLVTTTRGSGVR